MRTASHVRSRRAVNYAVDSLHALPCGCVAAVYRTPPWDVEFVALEARGPHCLNRQHKTGSVLGLDLADSGRLSR